MVKLEFLALIYHSEIEAWQLHYVGTLSYSLHHAVSTFSDDSLGYEYPFVLKVVQRGGSWCAWCPWHRFCRGCALPCSAKEFKFAASYLAIDWDQTALHLRYLANQEKVS